MAIREQIKGNVKVRIYKQIKEDATPTRVLLIRMYTLYISRSIPALVEKISSSLIFGVVAF